jgi:hypothetical protein
MGKANVAGGTMTSALCPRCRAHRLFRVPLSPAQLVTSGRTAQLMCADQVHCLYTDTEASRP